VDSTGDLDKATKRTSWQGEMDEFCGSKMGNKVSKLNKNIFSALDEFQIGEKNERKFNK
jgi:hypothetical protein